MFRHEAAAAGIKQKVLILLYGCNALRIASRVASRIRRERMRAPGSLEC